MSEINNTAAESKNSESDNILSIISNRRHVNIKIESILYVRMKKRNAEIHVAGGDVYESRIQLEYLEKKLGRGFIRVYRSCIISVLAIHHIGKTIELVNGEQLYYPIRKKRETIMELHEKRREIAGTFSVEGMPQTPDEYRSYYASFEEMPFAFTDIEIVFDNERNAIDWIFRYGNKALAKLEKTPLEKLIGSKFGDVFINMDPKWIKCYERAALYGERLELMDYSPEIDTYLKVICFPTFRGHCGCLLFDISEIEFMRSSNDSDNVISDYLGLTGGND